MTDENKGPPVIPVHPWVTRAVDAYPDAQREVVEFFFELSKRVALVAAIKLAAEASHSQFLSSFTNLGFIMLGLWIGDKTAKPLRAWQRRLTREERLQTKNQGLFLLGLTAVVCFLLVISIGSYQVCLEIVQSNRLKAITSGPQHVTRPAPPSARDTPPR